MRVSKRWRSTASRVMQPAVEGRAQKRSCNILTMRLASRGSCSVAALWPPDSTQNQVRTLSHLLRDLCEPGPVAMQRERDAQSWLQNLPRRDPV